MCRLILSFYFQELEPEQEDLLEQYYMKASDIHYGLSPKEVRRFAYTYAIAYVYAKRLISLGERRIHMQQKNSPIMDSYKLQGLVCRN